MIHSSRIDTPRTRGAAIAAVVLLLAAVQLLAVFSIESGVDDADQTVRRVVTARAFYAAEGASMIVSRQVRAGLAVPSTTQTLTIGSAVAQVIQAPTTLTAGTIVIEGTCDTARRRMNVTLDTSVQ
jgi:phosphoribosylcarboxyaminoimidazole (NCAIR) mutase